MGVCCGGIACGIEGVPFSMVELVAQGCTALVLVRCCANWRICSVSSALLHRVVTGAPSPMSLRSGMEVATLSKMMTVLFGSLLLAEALVERNVAPAWVCGVCCERKFAPAW